MPKIIPYRPSDHDAWDLLIKSNTRASVLHSRRFLDYHGERFREESFCIWNEAGTTLKGVFPLAARHDNRDIVISHPGSTYAGLILDAIDPEERASIFTSVARELSAAGYKKLIYKPMPAIFGAQFDESDLRFFTKIGKPIRTDLWAFLRLTEQFAFAPKRISSIKAALRKGLSVHKAISESDWIEFYELLKTNLATRHETKPVHTVDELLDIQNRLGNEAPLWLCRDSSGQIMSGVWCIQYNPLCVHAQYIASNEAGRRSGAVDLNLAKIIDSMKEEKYKLFSIGVSTMADGYSINEGLLKQKLRFGCGLTVCWQFEVSLADLEMSKEAP
jgi:hypothetical protein